MDYLEFAHELLEIRLKLIQVPVEQMLSKIERGEIFVLNYLLTHGEEIHPKELSVAMAVSTARISTLLSKLEEKKQVRRYVDDEDNRKVIVMLTEEGRQRIMQTREEMIPQICRFFEELGPEDSWAYLNVQKKLWELHMKGK